MSETLAPRRCPSCHRVCQQAVISTAIESADSLESSFLAPDSLLRRKVYCSGCGEIWESIEAPARMVADLAQTREALETAQRQITMLRLLLAKDRQREQAPLSALSIFRKAA